MPVVSGKRCLGGCKIQASGLEDEIYLLHRRFGSEFIYSSQIELDIVGRFAGSFGCILVQKHLAVLLEIYKMCMLTRYDRTATVAVFRAYSHIDIQLRRSILFKLDPDGMAFEIFASALHCIHIHILEHFEPVSRLAHKSAKSDSNGKTGHSGARNANTHSILQHIGRKPYSDAVGNASEHLRGLCHTQSHCDRLRTPYGGNYFALDQLYNFFTSCFTQHFSDGR